MGTKLKEAWKMYQNLFPIPKRIILLARHETEFTREAKSRGYPNVVDPGSSVFLTTGSVSGISFFSFQDPEEQLCIFKMDSHIWYWLDTNLQWAGVSDCWQNDFCEFQLWSYYEHSLKLVKCWRCRDVNYFCEFQLWSYYEHSLMLVKCWSCSNVNYFCEFQLWSYYELPDVGEMLKVLWCEWSAAEF